MLATMKCIPREAKIHIMSSCGSEKLLLQVMSFGADHFLYKLISGRVGTPCASFLGHFLRQGRGLS